jgi:hypothetical protein
MSTFHCCSTSPCRSSDHSRCGSLSGHRDPRHGVIRLLEALSHGGTQVGASTAKQIHRAVRTTFDLSDDAYRLNQFRSKHEAFPPSWARIPGRVFRGRAAPLPFFGCAGPHNQECSTRVVPGKVEIFLCSVALLAFARPVSARRLSNVTQCFSMFTTASSRRERMTRLTCTTVRPR